MVSKGAMVLMVKLIDKQHSDEKNFSANQRRASQFVFSYVCIFLAISYTFLDYLTHVCGQLLLTYDMVRLGYPVTACLAWHIRC